MGELEIRIAKIRMKTPLIAVSGVFGMEYYRVLPSIKGIGAIVTKSITLEPRLGNKEPRIIETKVGLLNSIGIQNDGLDHFIKEQVPILREIEVPKIVSIAGFSISEYVKCAERLENLDDIDGIELNVSCPNVDKGGIEFGCDSSMLSMLVEKVRKVVKYKTLIVKLTPNVSDITKPAIAAVKNGIDAISLINTLRGMSIDLNTHKPKLGNKFGGLSGDAIFPLAVYSVYRCYESIRKLREYSRNNIMKEIPIIGMGGVSSGKDALELILAGASGIGIGTALFRNENIFKYINTYLKKHIKLKNKDNISNIVGDATR